MRFPQSRPSIMSCRQTMAISKPSGGVRVVASPLALAPPRAPLGQSLMGLGGAGGAKGNGEGGRAVRVGPA